MFPKENRITKGREFTKIKKTGNVFQSASFGVAYFKRDDGKPSRFGFLVSSKVSSKASLRNKAKRALRESVRQHLLVVKPGFDIVFLGKEGIERKYTSDLMEEVKSVLIELKIL